ncbi:MAG: SMI1/KNR4 family protein [Mesorhizobium sp.]|uniref:SMI1/KNR4 family protein n=1 Tax=unclassified Mesorhizobium TaxID=325217 RepID=UPI000FCCA7A8|nr:MULTISPECIES: SMI1/KNR4 family protein [unclassified Mesorhizobium]RUV71948.1 SMI1/KNR4 family protein [Mesorhizobium sp. M5C.F.Cr.IN.023.01.1.1]RWF82280.1 MAG: SMI1/KNR4 family protein [Mesorhizobium sp.]RWF95781.1 MAG: SMI1/KNR4 family protein [Mesorhizobium sp.]RWI38142.1 MAG: SMI1/KNR4 family protein [Mesorhizobium sp.]RWI46120.1 MAG: SMI1/KNR4 family protein [Mesorhizobium sp.]
MMNNNDREKLVSEIASAKAELERLMFDEESVPPPARPATERKIEIFEKKCGFPLPAAFRAFLLLHDGWPDFDGDAAIFGTGGRNQEWIEETLDDLWENFEDFGKENPIEEGAIPIVLGEDANTSLFMWPPDKEKGGEATFREYRLAELTHSYADFDEYLVHFLKSLRGAIDLERNGEEAPDSGEDDE